MSMVIENLIKEGIKIESNTLSLLSPYITQHINRFVRYILDKERDAPELTFNIDLLNQN